MKKLPPSSFAPTRLHKYLAKLNMGSLRSLERDINLGLVRINGITAIAGQKLYGGEKVTYANKSWQVTSLPTTATKLLLYHKPVGLLCSHNGQGRNTIYQQLPANERWLSVGRLDINSSGLLLISNDGQLVQQLQHPSANLEREYLVRVAGVKLCNIKNLLQGVYISEQEFTKFLSCEHQRGNWYKVIVTEGKYREVRRMWQTQGLQVSRLLRIRYGNYKLPRNLLPGQWLNAQ